MARCRGLSLSTKVIRMSEPIKCFLLEVTEFKQPRTVTFDNGDTMVLEDTLWRRTDTGDLNTLQGHPAGAMWFAPWLDNLFAPQLEHVLIVKTPGGDWVIDSEASNCTMPAPAWTKESAPKRQSDHHCWILHGIAPNVTVDKNGVTCGAGGGSIGQERWHGFLRNGHLVE